ncbi:MAG: family 20 glycosylhydrolase [Nitrospirae bacterium]|nr:family 20 glycosylhydrolase [Nitrospirota bacterium]
MNRTSLFYSVLLLLVIILTMGSVTFAREETEELNLMPVPKQITRGDGLFRLSDSFTIAIQGKKGGARLGKAVTRTLRRLSDRTGIFFSQDFIRPGGNVQDADFIISCNRQGKLILHEDESYQLRITPEKIELSAETDIGILRGLATFNQLLNADEKGYYFPSVEIKDAPRFPWRGLLIDVGRHFMPVEVIKRNLSGMAAVKMNVLHLHLTEDQGFRVECKTFPKLHELGSDGFYYTQEQIKDIISYAADRGIRVMPEFDMPGHATSWFVGYPELSSAPGRKYTIARKWGIKDPTMDPTREETYVFLDKFFAEMTALFPDRYIHIGGDENNGRQWNANPDIQAYMKAHNIPDNHALQRYFNQRILKILQKYNKKMVGWDEIFQPELPKDIVIQSWRGQTALIKAAQKGYQTILSNGYYIDLIQPASYLYLNDPLPKGALLTEKQKKYILGGEATMWGEFVSPETIDSRIWPRTAVIAERLWSPGSIRDVDDMYRRLPVVSLRLEELGLLHEKNYGMMLRRLANSHDITALKTLVDVLEPVKGYKRGSLREYTSYSPLTRVVDAARPDAVVARHFRELVNSYLSGNKGTKDEIVSWLNLWKNNHGKLLIVINRSPILKEVEPLSRDLSDLAGVGLQALKFRNEHKKPSEEWIQENLIKIEKAKEPRGETELMIVSAVEKLVESSK